MKKMKLAVLGAAVMAMTGFSSCLDSGDTNNLYPGMEFVDNTGSIAGAYYRFKNASGLTLIPSNAAEANKTSVDTRYALISYQYSPDSLKQNSTTLPITLQGIAPVKESSYSIPNEDNTWANAPVYSVTAGPMLPYFDENNLFLGVQYYVKLDSEGDLDDAEKGSAHSFRLYCAEKEEESIQGSDLILYLLHNVSDTSINNERKSSEMGEYVHFDISRAVNWYKSLKSDLPENLVIKYKIPASASGEGMLDYDKAIEASSPVKITYKQWMPEDKQ